MQKKYKSNDYETNINIRIDRELNNNARKYAKKKGLSKSEFIRLAIQNAIQKEIANEIKIEVERDYR